jgi:hypothetical protein
MSTIGGSAVAQPGNLGESRLVLGSVYLYSRVKGRGRFCWQKQLYKN